MYPQIKACAAFFKNEDGALCEKYVTSEKKLVNTSLILCITTYSVLHFCVESFVELQFQRKSARQYLCWYQCYLYHAQLA